MYRFIIVIPIFFFLAGCSVGSDRNTEQFVIIDQQTNKVLNRYEYSKSDGRLIGTESYNDQQKVRKDIEYEYDSKGNLVKTVERSAGSSPKVVTYHSTQQYDSAGRLVKTTRTSSDGEVVETHFGYDETGTLRGVVEQVDADSVLMKDY